MALKNMPGQLERTLLKRVKTLQQRVEFQTVQTGVMGRCFYGSDLKQGCHEIPLAF